MNIFEKQIDYMTEELPEEEKNIKFYEEKYEIVSRVAFLCGLSDFFYKKDNGNFLPAVFESLSKNPKAMIIRHLCLIRTSIENNFKKLNDAMFKEGRSFFALTEYYPKDSLSYLENAGIRLPVSSRQLTDILGDINKNIADRINNCKDIMPTWIKWDYIRELFVMPNGTKTDGMKAAAELFYNNKSFYPYGLYINWKPYDTGNLFLNDYRFATAIYEWHKDVFLDVSNLSDVGEDIKDRIYEFLDNSSKSMLIVDCENADPYSLCAMFNCIDDEQADKISKIVLYDDPQAPSGWKFFEQHVNIDPSKIEHIVIQRILENKSLLDVKLTARVTKEFFKRNVDSFILVSSDSDFWGLIEELPDAQFLVMLEHRKASQELLAVLEDNDIFYCFTDNFYTGLDDSLRKKAMFSEFNAFFDRHSFNAIDLFKEVLRKTRVEMPDGEYQQFYDKYLKTLSLRVEKNGDVKIEMKK